MNECLAVKNMPDCSPKSLVQVFKRGFDMPDSEQLCNSSSRIYSPSGITGNDPSLPVKLHPRSRPLRLVSNTMIENQKQVRFLELDSDEATVSSISPETVVIDGEESIINNNNNSSSTTTTTSSHPILPRNITSASTDKNCSISLSLSSSSSSSVVTGRYHGSHRHSSKAECGHVDLSNHNCLLSPRLHGTSAQRGRPLFRGADCHKRDSAVTPRPVHSRTKRE